MYELDKQKEVALEQYYMLSWSGCAVDHEYMLVARRVAVQMMTGVIESSRVMFTHDLCAGTVEFRKQGAFVGGGSFFLADFGMHAGAPHTAEFFIPRSAVRLRNEADSMILASPYGTEGWEYPEDIRTDRVFGKGLRIRALGS